MKLVYSRVGNHFEKCFTENQALLRLLSDQAIKDIVLSDDNCFS